jgi:outer membrane receptor protein involved in Fe transport
MVSSLALAGLLLVLQPSFPGASSAVSGVILDPLGSPVAGARIVSTADRRCAATSADDGRFVLPCEDREAPLRVSAPGFRPVDIALADGATGSLTIVLQPTPHTEMVVVTATRAGDRVVSRAAPVSTLAAGDLALTPPAPLDDLLRSVPGFSLFRRSSSRVSNPTTQGATLRGLSASGAGRALVLADGLPLNDPFGGWVSWNRVPHTSVERVEVVRGGASDLYGADALAGVVQRNSPGALDARAAPRRSAGPSAEGGT